VTRVAGKTTDQLESKRLREAWQVRALTIGPAAAMLILLTVVPLCLMVYISLQERDWSGSVIWGNYSFEAYIRFIFERNLDDSLQLNADYLRIFLRSFWLSLLTTGLSLMVGFPTALFIATRDPKWRAALVFLTTVPFWTNLLVRNYAWILLLRDTGPINAGLQDLGLIDTPIAMLYTNFAVSVGLTYSFLPFMVLPIYASLEKMDFRLVEASFDLYATRLKTLWHVMIPAAKPGIIAGCILVFVPCLGSYVTPALLGGGKSMMIGNLIGLQFGAARNWPFGAALGFALLTLILLSMLFYVTRVRRQENR